MNEPPGCLACGTCCFSTLLDYVRVTGSDFARIDDRTDELVHFTGNRAYLNMVDGHCAALRIDPVSRELACSAYSIRPDVCRDLVRGEPACLGEIAEKGARPLIALGRA